jgi:DNA polymerase phi
LYAERLFSRNASSFQKFRGLLIFSSYLQGFAANESGARKLITPLFSKHLMACLMNHAAEQDRYLHRIALKALAAVESVAASNQHTVYPMLSSLLGSNGGFNFDQRTKTQTVAKVLHHAGGQDATKVIKLLREGVFSAIK